MTMLGVGVGGGLLTGLIGASSKKAGIEASLKHLVENINILTNAVLIIFLILGVYLLYFVIKRIANHLFLKRKNESIDFLNKLQIDLIIFKNIGTLSEDDRITVNNSIQNSIKVLRVNFSRRIFYKRIGKDFCLRVYSYLGHISDNDIDIDDQISLISNLKNIFV